MDNQNSNGGLNIDDLTGVPGTQSNTDYNAVQPNTQGNETQAPVNNPMESPQPSVSEPTPTVAPTAPVESLPSTEGINLGEPATTAVTPEIPNVVEQPTTPPVANMESVPPVESTSSPMPENISQPTPTVAPVAENLPTESTDIVNTLDEKPQGEGKGGSAIVIVLIVVIVALLVTIGYFAYKIFF